MITLLYFLYLFPADSCDQDLCGERFRNLSAFDGFFHDRALSENSTQVGKGQLFT